MADIKCPHCDKQFNAEPSAVFNESTSTFIIKIEDGHMLQAKTIGGVLTNLALMYRQQAKELGARIEVLVKDIRFSSNNIEFDLLSTRIVEKPKK
jgi:hypothetical protein